MASRRGFWLRIDVFELLEGDSQYKNLVHDVQCDIHLVKIKYE